MNLFSLTGGALLALVSVSAAAVPIPNNAFADQSVGWFAASKAVCPAICQRHGANAELEKNSAAPVTRSFVCKVRKSSGGDYWWLWGTQFGSRPACYVTDRDLKGEYLETFYCLCAKQIESASALPRAIRRRDDG